MTDHAQFFVQNNQNFKESGMWVRFMLFKDGMWVDFEENAMDVMVSDFVSGKAIIEMEMEGCNLIF